MFRLFYAIALNLYVCNVCLGESGKADAVLPVPVREAVAHGETAGGAGDRQRHQRQEDVRTP